MPTETLREQLETLKNAELTELLCLLGIKEIMLSREENITRILEEDTKRVERAFLQITTSR